jgi:RNA polymerase sigma factor (sigma-70 family)
VSTHIPPGPEQAAALYREHGRGIRAYLRARLGDGPAVEDLCQDTFLSAIRSGLPEGPPGPWLFGIARKKALKHHRDHKPTAALVSEPAGSAHEPSAVLSQSETRARVRAAVRGLADELREAIRLRYEAGLTYPEIAARLGVPTSTIQGRAL